MASKISGEEIRVIPPAKSLKKYDSFLVKSITLMECPNAGT